MTEHATTASGLPRTADADRRWRLDAARTWLSSGGSLLFFGSVRTGRSPMVDAVVAASRAQRVLRCTPSRSHPSVPYFALADLLSPVTDGELDALPAAHRQVLARALLRTDTPPGQLGSPVAVRPAVLALLRTLARATPLLLVIDDLQRLDGETADVLRFLARNAGGLPIQTIASEWVPGDRPPVGYQLCVPPLLALPMGPCTVDG